VTSQPGVGQRTGENYTNHGIYTVCQEKID
jgi:hypothetical protein